MKEITIKKLNELKAELVRGETSYHIVAAGIIQLMKEDTTLSQREIAKYFGKSQSWVSVLIKWHEQGGEGPIDWHRGKKDIDSIIEKYLDETPAEKIVERMTVGKQMEVAKNLSPATIARAVAEDEDIARAISLDGEAKVKLGWADAETMAKRHAKEVTDILEGKKTVEEVRQERHPDSTPNTDEEPEHTSTRTYRLNFMMWMKPGIEDLRRVGIRVASLWNMKIDQCDDEKQLELVRQAVTDAAAELQTTILDAMYPDTAGEI